MTHRIVASDGPAPRARRARHCSASSTARASVLRRRMLRSRLLVSAIALVCTTTAQAQEPAVDVSMPEFCAASDQQPDLSSTFPTEALRRRRGGTAVIDCAMNEQGRTSTCRVISESPANREFGRGALEVACRFVIPRRANGELNFTRVDGHYFDQQSQTHRVRTTVNFSARGSAVGP